MKGRSRSSTRSTLVAAIALAGTVKWQRLGDLVAETEVVRDKKGILSQGLYCWLKSEYL